MKKEIINVAFPFLLVFVITGISSAVYDNKVAYSYSKQVTEQNPINTNNNLVNKQENEAIDLSAQQARLAEEEMARKVAEEAKIEAEAEKVRQEALALPASQAKTIAEKEQLARDKALAETARINAEKKAAEQQADLKAKQIAAEKLAAEKAAALQAQVAIAKQKSRKSRAS